MLTKIVIRFFFASLIAISANWIAIAFAHHQGDYFPISPSQFPLMLEMQRTGQWPWEYKQECNEGNIRADIAGAFEDSRLRWGVLFPEVNQGLRQLNISTCGAAFTARCGAGFAVACVGSASPYYPRNCDAAYNGPYLTTFALSTSRKAVPKHEWLHCSNRRAEGYNDITYQCIPSDTIMGCGPSSPKEYTAHDDAAWYNEHMPDLVEAFLARNPITGQLFLYWNQAGYPATDVAIHYEDWPSGVLYYTGLHGAPTGNTGLYVDLPPPGVFRCYLAEPVNGVSWYAQSVKWYAGCVAG